MDKEILHKIALTIGQLSIEAVEKAKSGHPGLPLGCAELGAYLYGVLLRHNPKNPNWLNRDRMVLSAGHGSMWLYSCLHLSGFKITLDDIKQFRQLGSITPGHPEYHLTEGVEATTGPLGQGVGNAVGMALGFKILSTKFNRDGYPLFNNKIYCIAGDGCIMEGVSSEASSFAGHLGLNNLVLIYDSNKVCLDGALPQCCSEDTAARYRAYGWDVYDLDGYDFDAMDKLFTSLQKKQDRPAFIVCHTKIGHGSPKEGTNKAHGEPLGPEELIKTKKTLGMSDEPFYVPQVVRQYFESRLAKDAALEADWNLLYKRWAGAFPELAAEFEKMRVMKIPTDLEQTLSKLEIKQPCAGRAASNTVLQELGKLLPQLLGGSADLSTSDKTMMSAYPLISPGHFEGRNIKFGVREFGMGTIVNGLSTTGMLLPYCGTFFTFSDYMRNSIRLAALSHYHVIYQFTHDSIFLGEDGPTHQPIEQLASLRAMPNLHLIRPADANEVKMAWLAALQYQGPTAIILSRQSLPEIPHTKVPYAEGLSRGGYIIIEANGKPDYTIFSTGSELHLACDAAQQLTKMDKKVRVVSMPCWELFDKQPPAYKQKVCGGDIGIRVAIEAGSELGWHKYIGLNGIAICLERFGASAPEKDLAKAFGFTVEDIVERLIAAK
jgi:transketolase